MGLTRYEMEIIRSELGREPTKAEWLIFEAEWSEHCSYKSSRKWLKLLPVSSPHVVRGPGLDAPLIRVGNTYVSFKIESHNHPSAVDPYDGAATGVGGIVRDILTLGLRPIALMDNLHFGPITDGHSLWIARNVVRGISDYGNRIGVPVVAGETWFDESFSKNPIVLVTCVGTGKEAVIGNAKPGDLVLVIGNDTGRDGMLGSSFASRELLNSSNDIGAVQVGNPLLEKLLIDSIIELSRRGLVKAIKDVGGGGLATALSELADQFNLGMRVYLDRVRLRDKLSTEEILISESQERMVIIVDKDSLASVEEILNKFGVSYDIIGELTEDGMFMGMFKDEVVINLPVKLIVNAPETNYSVEKPQYLDEHRSIPRLPEVDFRESLIKVLKSPNIASKEGIFRTYDYEVGIRTVIKPGMSGAAVLRLLEEDGGDGKLGIAIKADANPRYSFLDPFIGAANSLAKAYRNVVSVGGRPIAAVDSINVGNPEKPDRYWYFVESVKGLSYMGRELNIPFVGGKVSFYNEDASSGKAIKPVVAVAVLGVVDDVSNAVQGGLEGSGHLVLIGETENEIGGSEYLHLVHGLVRGVPPRPKPREEVVRASAIIEAVNNGLIMSLMDVGIGGLATTLCKMAFIGNTGLSVDLSLVKSIESLDPITIAFSETNARYIVETQDLESLVKVLDKYDTPYSIIGRSGGNMTVFKWGDKELASLHIEEVKELMTLRGVP